MKYTFEKMLEDLAIGHEVEFKYKGEKYSISTNKDGWYLTKYSDWENYQSFKTYMDLINRSNIDNKKIKDIWKDVKVESVF